MFNMALVRIILSFSASFLYYLNLMKGNHRTEIVLKFGNSSEFLKGRMQKTTIQLFFFKSTVFTSDLTIV